MNAMANAETVNAEERANADAVDGIMALAMRDWHRLDYDKIAVK